MDSGSMDKGTVQPFSKLALSIERKEQELALKALYSAAPPWTGKDASEAQRRKRRAAAKDSYKQWDEIYFPPEMYAGQYAAPCEFHSIVAESYEQGGKDCTLIIGPHDHGKSATGYKAAIRLALFGKKHFVGVISETLDTPKAIISAISSYLHTNERIKYDFPDLKYLVDDKEELHISTKDNPQGTVFKAFSEERSPRGKNVNLFFRLDLIMIEDLENRMSSMTAESVSKRKGKLSEYKSALTDDGCMVMTANNFDERCLVNKMKAAAADGTLDASWHVMHFEAWGKNPLIKSQRRKPGPLWQNRFPAKSEAELRGMLKPMDDATWEGSYQGNPRKPEGEYFKRQYVTCYDEIPDGCVGVVYVDPNLAKKAQGDRTCMIGVFWHFETNTMYVWVWRYKSFSDSNDLLEELRQFLVACLSARIQVIAVGMDGNVNQESHWSQHVYNYQIMHGFLLPPISWCKYTVELIAKNAQLYWTNGKVRMPAAPRIADEYENFEQDFHAFTGKKLPGAKDDAPDAFCCGVQLMIEIGLGDTFTETKIISGAAYRMERRPHIGRL